LRGLSRDRGKATEAICPSIRQIASLHCVPLAMTVRRGVSLAMTVKMGVPLAMTLRRSNEGRDGQ